MKGPQRLSKAPLAPLPPFEKNANSLPREIVFTIIYKMANFQNWSDVAYRASGHRTVEDKLRASWQRDDARADVNEYMDQLNEEQRKIVDAAFRGGLAEVPPGLQTPDEITLEWVEANFPTRNHNRVR